MNIASQKRKENVAEYILFIWQLTDLLRTLQFDAKKIEESLITPLNLDSDKAAEELKWYVEMASIIEQEGKVEKGFLSITLYLIQELYEFHLRLLKEPSEENYRMLVFNATPAIVSFKEKVSEPLSNDIEYCFYALYSKLLMQLKGMSLSKETSDSFIYITNMIAYLSKRFGEYERGEYSLVEE